MFSLSVLLSTMWKLLLACTLVAAAMMLVRSMAQTFRFQTMFSLSKMSSMTSKLLPAFASLAAAMMLVRSMAKEIPDIAWSYLHSAIHYLFKPNQLTIVIEDDGPRHGYTCDQLYKAAEVYLCTKIDPSTNRFKVTQAPKQKKPSVAIAENQELIDTFEGIKLKWRLVSIELFQHKERFFELCFNKKFKDTVLNQYLPSVLEDAVKIKEKDKVVKLYTIDHAGGGGGGWGWSILDHPATFETLAMEPDMKEMIMDDLKRFVKRKDYYRKVGRPWKRGYLLYGPPGTGKSTLIAAMAYHLKFDIYDLELSGLRSNSELRSIMLSTANRSIVVIEDIDCSVEIQDGGIRGYGMKRCDTKVTLSGLLNFIDGLWSSCGDERIIIFTTNHKDKLESLDPALLRPGRMDMRIHMSYLTAHGFKILASTYLGIQDHPLFGKIEGLIKSVEVTPAEVAGKLMKHEDPDEALDGVVKFLVSRSKKVVEENTTHVETQEA